MTPWITPAARRRLSSWFALIGALSPVWFVAIAAVFAALRPDYRFADAISRLGEEGSANAATFQVLAFGGAGLLDGLFSVAVADAFGRAWFFKLTALQALALGGTALFDCDPGCPFVPVTPPGALHNMIGLSYFVFASAVPFVAWRTFRTRKAWSSLAPFALAMGLILVAIFVSLPLFGVERWGLWQRAFATARFLWLVPVALRLHQLLRQAEGRPAGASARHAFAGKVRSDVL